MDYRLSLTPRLLALAGLSFLMLLVLLFLLGVHAGRSLPSEIPAGASAALPAFAASHAARAASMATRTASQAAG
ncbi:MAG: hypothetical protein ACOVK6_04245, partial [Ramlibacter sp.]